MPVDQDLLPEGLRDRLPPEAAAAAGVVRALLDGICGCGYARVDPPLVEYEDALSARLQSARVQDMARFVDPLSQQTLAIRPDITPQVGRIAATQLAAAPRPLRLAYAGPVLRLTPTQLSPARQSMQVGAELIGSDTVDAGREIVSTAVDALGAAGIDRLTIDFTLPDLVDTLADRVLSPERRDVLRHRLDMKDAGALAEAGFADWLPLAAAPGPIAPALDALRRFDHAGLLASRIEGLAAIADAVGGRARVTLDPTERHGFEYQSWFGFSLFAGDSGFIGRGGSYAIDHGGGKSEPATGFSIYPDDLNLTVKDA